MYNYIQIILLTALVTLGVYMWTGCGPHQGANVAHFIDCVGDGCDSSYQDKVREFRGDDGADGSDSKSVTSTIVKETAIPGPVGPAGSDGSSCSVDQVTEGVLIQCDDGSAAIVYNGVNGSDGEDGSDGQDGASPLLYTLDPCGSQTQYDEVILVFEINDSLIYIAYFESGTRRYLTSLIEGPTYQTTDGTECKFQLLNGAIIEIN